MIVFLLLCDSEVSIIFLDAIVKNYCILTHLVLVILIMVQREWEAKEPEIRFQM